jgi:hypothetical protein
MKILIVLVAILAALIYWSKKSAKAVASVVVGGNSGKVSVSEVAKLAAESPTLSVSSNSLSAIETGVTNAAKLSDAYFKVQDALPSTANAIKQAQAQINNGQAGASDIIVFNATLTAYQNYAAKGGTMTYEQFTNAAAYQDTGLSAGISKADLDTIKSAKDTVTRMDAAKILADTPAANLQARIDGMSDGNPLKAALLTMVPALSDGFTAAEQAAEDALRKAANYGVPVAEAAQFANMNSGEELAYLQMMGYGGY